MYKVYVLDKNGHPMDPTVRFGKVRRMLDDDRAVVVQRKPFTIRLTYETQKHFTKRYGGGTDPGRENIGNAVLSEEGDVPYADHVTTRNREVPKNMAKRKAHSQASRRGERQRRKRRAAKNGTTTAFPKGRKLPQCGEPVMLKDIINTEAKFCNRKRSVKWLTPTARQLLQTHLNRIRNICKILPVTEWTLEVNRFAFMQMEDGTVRGVDFQNGRMKGYPNVNTYIDDIQEGRCALCGKPIAHHHHIVPKRSGGSDTPENIIGLCESCHTDVHTGKQNLDVQGLRKQYAHLSVLNQIIPYLIDELVRMFGEEHVHLVQGYETGLYRTFLGLEKDHHTDAIAIAAMGMGVEEVFYDKEVYEIRQYRRQDRARIKSQRERTYKLDGVTVAKNRKPRFEQQGPALSDWYETQTVRYGRKAAEKMRSRLTVTASKRYYNAPDRIMPGAAFLYNGRRYILTGQLTNGAYYRAYGQGKTNFPAKKCRILTKNTGLVYV